MTTSDTRWLRGDATARDASFPAVPDEVEAFHRSLPGYAPTALRPLPSVAAELGVGDLLVKDESSRFGLGAFKMLGASWAAARALAARRGPGGDGTDGDGPAAPLTLDGLRAAVAADPAVLVTATDGNHGRAVARMARLVGAGARVVVPAVVPADAVQRIRDEGAQVSTVDGSYDDAVAEAARLAAADPAALLVQDTAWPGYETVPAWVVEGYATLVREADEQVVARTGRRAADLVVVPAGVGSFAQAVVAHLRAAGRPREERPAVLVVEPDTAACVLASLAAGEPVTVPTAGTVMAGLNCGTVSALAWPVLAAGVDAAVAVTDDAARQAVADLAALGVSAGPCGAAPLAGLRHLLAGDGAQQRRAALGLGPDSVVVLLSTEGRLGR